MKYKYIVVNNTRIVYGYDGKILRSIHRYLNNNLHDESLPAAVLFYPDGRLKLEQYYYKGKLYAIRKYNPDGLCC